jgi:hypothetical protein
VYKSVFHIRRVFSILDQHAVVSRVGDKYILKPIEKAKVLHNGKQVIKEVELQHLDRLVFGTSQYYLFAVPAVAKGTDPYYTFEMMQDEIGRASGMIGQNNNNMTQGQYNFAR